MRGAARVVVVLSWIVLVPASAPPGLWAQGAAGPRAEGLLPPDVNPESRNRDRKSVV